MFRRRRPGTPASAAPSFPPERRRRRFFDTVVRRPSGSVFRQDRFPVFDELRRSSVNLQPRQRLAEDAAVGQGALRARAR
jgi:hypothetical protein